jgi:uncharacterized protein
MKIRSITYFINPEYPINVDKIKTAGKFIQIAMAAYGELGYEVQTVRLATIPFPLMWEGLSNSEMVVAAKHLEEVANGVGFDYIAIGPALIEKPNSYFAIPEILANTENIFCSAEMATKETGIDVTAISKCAEIITNISTLDENGFGNLFFTTLANVPSGSPFFPAAYHIGDGEKFAIATESANLAVEAFTNANSLNEGIENLVNAIEDNANKLSTLGKQLSSQHKVGYGGIDFSLAPFPEDSVSLGAVYELIGIEKIGNNGSLAVSAMLANAIDRANFDRVGFSGLLLPPLEDSRLAKRAADGSLTINDLLMFSTVCGTGLDTIPLPGNSTPDQLVSILLDLAALALRLDKPLTARLMPIPGKQAGEETTFDFPFFANSKIMSLAKSNPLSGLIANEKQIRIERRS